MNSSARVTLRALLSMRRNFSQRETRQGLENFGFKVSPAPVFFKLSKNDRRLVTVMLSAYDVVAHLRPLNCVEDKGRRVVARCMIRAINHSTYSIDTRI
jgi:hypothetical protein